MNFSETSSISRMLEKEGFEKKDFTEKADVYVINTCSVTDNADKECRQIVRRIQRKSPESSTACLVTFSTRSLRLFPRASGIVQKEQL